MHLWVGTSGYSYKEWKGSFYPEKLAAKDMLAFYAAAFPSVEINSTFYRLPRTSTLESWAAIVPAGFRFVVKASRRITHLKRLKAPDEETAYLFEALVALGPKLGAVLVQLPPNLKLDLERLDAFLALLPAGARVAFEFRNATWMDDAVFTRLRDHGCAVVTADTDDAPVETITSTATWGYLRLRGTGYDDATLANWARRVRDTGWTDAFVFFKHEDEGEGPAMARSFREAFDHT